MDWQPWRDYETPPNVVKVEILDIPEPPCKNCVHWRPQRLYLDTDKGVIFDGVKLCHSPDMVSDFSCYIPRPTE